MSNIPFNPDKAHALTIGVGQRNVDNATMATTALDAERIKYELIKRAGFQPPKVPLLINEDATKANILGQLDVLAAATKDAPAEMVIIYFSGHGCVINNTYYIVCRDTINDDVEHTAIEGSIFADKLLSIQTDKMLILLDCCHSGGIYNAQSAPGAYKPADVPFVKDAVLAQPNRVIISASAASEVSFASQPLSVFTYALVEGLAGMFFSPGNNDVDCDTDVTLFNLAMYLRERVCPLSGNLQHPQLNIVQNATTSDFLIARYPSGQQKPPLFDSGFLLKTNDGKDINTGTPVVKDEEFRSQYNWLVNVTGDNNNVIIGNTGTVAINTVTQTAQQIINIQKTETVNFYLKNQNKPFNQYLVKALIDAIKDNPIAKACITANLKDPDWNQKKPTLSRAQEAIINSYTNVIGGQLRPLFAIGALPYSADQQTNYVNQCIAVATTTLQLLCFTLLSDLWSQKKEQPFDLEADERTVLTAFFEYNGDLNYDIKTYLALFQTLNNMYCRLPQLKLPIDELKGFSEQLKTDSLFYIACSQLDAIQNTADIDKFTDENCGLAETNLADFLVALSFLSSYKMVSIKSVNYDDVRNDVKNTTAHYLHKFVFLGDKNTAATDTQGVNYLRYPVSTDSILLYKNDYNTDGINLFPFIMDYNALTTASGGLADNVKICFYSAVGQGTDTDKYGQVTATDTIRLCFSDDGTEQVIVNSGILQSGRQLDFSVLLKNDIGRITFKNDTVFVQFWDAKATMLGAV